MNRMERLGPIEAERATEWLEEVSVGRVEGYDVGGFPAYVWIPHAMYETADVPGGLTHDEVQRMERAAWRSVEPPEKLTPVEVEMERMIDESWSIGSPLGVSSSPGDGWRRLFWSELAERLDHDPWALDVPPCHRSFPFRSWPANIRPPAEGSLDREQLVRVVEHLAAVSGAGRGTRCHALFASLPTREVGQATIVYAAELRELPGLVGESDFGPANVWPPETRDWLTFSHVDLWATRVGGSEDFVRRLRDDPELETVVLPFPGDSPQPDRVNPL